MSEINITLDLVNNLPKLTISLNEDKSLTQNIADLQIKSRSSEIFVDDLRNKKDSIEFVNGVVITRLLKIKKETFHAKFIKIFEGKTLEFFDNSRESLAANNLSIPEMISNKEASVKYKVDYFRFSSNLINLTDIKLEENIIYENYKKFKNNLSSGRVQKIIKDIKSKKSLYDIDKVFFDIFTKSNLETSKTILNSVLSEDDSFNLEIASIGKFISLIISSKKINKYDFDIKEISIYKRKNKKIETIEYKKFSVKEVKYKIQGGKIYIPLMSSDKFNYYSKLEDKLFLNVSTRIYNKNSLNIVSTKRKDFNLKG